MYPLDKHAHKATGTSGFALHAAVLWGGSLFTSCTIQCGILLGSALKVKLITLHLLSKLLSTMMKKIVAKDNVHKVKPKKI